jgi:hypothetical protein
MRRFFPFPARVVSTHRQRRFVEYHVFIHQDEYHRVWVLFFPFPLRGIVRDVLCRMSRFHSSG